MVSVHDKNEWYTPPEIIDRVRGVFGGVISFDPFSTWLSNASIRAVRYYDQSIDATRTSWDLKPGDTVFMNPPYSGRQIAPAVDAFIREAVRPNTDMKMGNESIVLVNNSTETVWFQKLLKHSAAVCFPRHRIKFWRSDNGIVNQNRPVTGQAIFYYGPYYGAFNEGFSECGHVMATHM